jgi:pimeloyl-ACP methyl ester carboxylesterase
MEPIVLIHGYSAESRTADLPGITSIYGTLPQALRAAFGTGAVQEIDLSRYITLEDGVTVDDISRALDRALREEYSHLLTGGFHVIIHSTGALVIRNWIRRFSKKPSPVRKLIYLAGANLGSGWAHIGKGQLAQWGRFVFQGGAERGVQVLDALELGSNWTLDLHLHFLRPGFSMTNDYQVLESVVIGTQADVSWFEVPIRYAKEDGADGVVRVSASNVNFNYVRFGPTAEALGLSWKDAADELASHRERAKDRTPYYEIKQTSRPGDADRPVVPFAIPYECAHSGDRMGVVTGSRPRTQVMRLIKLALQAPDNEWPGLVQAFQDETEATYRKALTGQAPAWWLKWIQEPRAQYDHHSQVVLRIRDQDARPVPHYDIFFDSIAGRRDTSRPINSLFEDKHVNGLNPNIIVFYLRTDEFVDKKKGWVPRVPEVNGCYLEVSAVEPETQDILYLPMRYEFSAEQLNNWIQGHHTTVIDVELLRLPSPNVFKIVKYP